MAAGETPLADAWRCPICLDRAVGAEGTPEAVVTLPCHPAHRYHQQCLATLERHGEWRCLLCRAPIHPEQPLVRLQMWMHTRDSIISAVFVPILVFAVVYTAYFYMLACLQVGLLRREEVTSLAGAFAGSPNQTNGCPGPSFLSGGRTGGAVVYSSAHYDYTTCIEDYIHIQRHATAKGNVDVEGAFIIKGLPVTMQQDVDALWDHIIDLQQMLILLSKRRHNYSQPNLLETICVP